MFLSLLSYIGSFIDRCLSVYYHLCLQAGYYWECKKLCSSTFNSISPPTSPQAFEQQRSGTLKSGVESAWHGKGSLKVLLFETFQSPTESTGRTIMGRLGGSTGEDRICGNEALSISLASSYSASSSRGN